MPKPLNFGQRKAAPALAKCWQSQVDSRFGRKRKLHHCELQKIFVELNADNHVKN